MENIYIKRISKKAALPYMPNVRGISSMQEWDTAFQELQGFLDQGGELVIGPEGTLVKSGDSYILTPEIKSEKISSRSSLKEVDIDDPSLVYRQDFPGELLYQKGSSLQ